MMINTFGVVADLLCCFISSSSLALIASFSTRECYLPAVLPCLQAEASLPVTGPSLSSTLWILRLHRSIFISTIHFYGRNYRVVFLLPGVVFAKGCEFLVVSLGEGFSNSSRGSQAWGHYPRKTSENPADPRRTVQRPRRTLGETPQSPLKDPRRAL